MSHWVMRYGYLIYRSKPYTPQSYISFAILLPDPYNVDTDLPLIKRNIKLSFEYNRASLSTCN